MLLAAFALPEAEAAAAGADGATGADGAIAAGADCADSVLPTTADALGITGDGVGALIAGAVCCAVAATAVWDSVATALFTCTAWACACVFVPVFTTVLIPL